MNDRIIPFGKYKGKPIEILATDSQYTEWLLAQSFFKEKHITLYNVVINNYREPVDTPEHNKIQIRFLESKYRFQLAFLVNKELFKYTSEIISEKINELFNEFSENEKTLFIESLMNSDEDFGLVSQKLLIYPKPTFENVDVYFAIGNGLKFSYSTSSYSYSTFDYQSNNFFWIEIKPTISDDYPAVLRQMKASMPVKRSMWNHNNFYILLVGSYTGVGATKQQFIEFFNSQGYIVVFEKEIEKVVLPGFKMEFEFSDVIKKRIEEYKKNEK